LFIIPLLYTRFIGLAGRNAFINAHGDAGVLQRVWQAIASFQFSAFFPIVIFN
jgi:hypothetical protein